MTREEILKARIKASRYQQLCEILEWALVLFVGGITYFVIS